MRVSQTIMRGLGSAWSRAASNAGTHHLDIVAVHPLDEPAERFQLVDQRLEGHHLCRGPSACWLLTSMMPIRLSSFQWAADMMASQTEPSSSSPSENRV